MGGKIPTTDDRKIIAAFDFDGTITKRDTLPLFINFASTKRQLLFGSLKMAPSLFLFKLKFIPNYKAKERLFRIFFGGMKIEKFDKLCEAFTFSIEKVLNPVAIEKIKWHQKMNHQVIIISASAENWIRPWAAKYGIDVILATQLQVKDNNITGNFLTQNCHGAEKVCRLLQHYPDKESYTLYAYGDSSGDKELLALADHAYYRSF